jgi:hypothetical protein
MREVGDANLGAPDHEIVRIEVDRAVEVGIVDFGGCLKVDAKQRLSVDVGQSTGPKAMRIDECAIREDGERRDGDGAGEPVLHDHVAGFVAVLAVAANQGRCLPDRCRAGARRVEIVLAYGRLERISSRDQPILLRVLLELLKHGRERRVDFGPGSARLDACLWRFDAETGERDRDASQLDADFRDLTGLDRDAHLFRRISDVANPERQLTRPNVGEHELAGVVAEPFERSRDDRDGAVG